MTIPKPCQYLALFSTELTIGNTGTHFKRFDEGHPNYLVIMKT